MRYPKCTSPSQCQQHGTHVLIARYVKQQPLCLFHAERRASQLRQAGYVVAVKDRG